MSEETSIGGRPAVYMETAPAEGDSAENSSTEGTANENTTGAKKNIYDLRGTQLPP